MKVGPIENVKISDIKYVMCAWAGCTATCEMDDKPPGWINLLTWRSPWTTPEATIGETACGAFYERDAVLCPRHAAELETLLKDIGGRLRETAGSA